MQVDLLMPNGEWILNRSDAQDVANHIAMGADMWDTTHSTKYELRSHGSMFNPDFVGVMVSGVEVPLKDFLAGKPTAQSYLTDVGTGGGSTIIDVNVESGPGDSFLPGDDGGGEVTTAGIGGQMGGLAVLGLVALAFFATKRKR